MRGDLEKNQINLKDLEDLFGFKADFWRTHLSQGAFAQYRSSLSIYSTAGDFWKIFKERGLPKAKAMDKIFYAVIFSFVISFLSTSCVSFSANDKNNYSVPSRTTGAACSIADLNKMSKYKYAMENSCTGPPSEKNLRPVKVDSPISNGNGIGCNLGLCITEKIFKAE